MNGTERVRRAILGMEYDRQPIYGWVAGNLDEPINKRFGSVRNFEDRYEFDIAHVFGGADPFRHEVLADIRSKYGMLRPDIMLDKGYLSDPDDIGQYEDVKAQLAFHKSRGRFCYVQTPGFIENYNGIFGIENHLLYLAEYEDEIAELFRRQASWNKRFARVCIDLGLDMIHISDDWGSQRDLMFSPALWERLVYPNMKDVVDFVHNSGALCSLHSDGCIAKVADGIARLGLDLVHPWQESAGMSLDLYLEKYKDKFAIMGGICVQTAIGVMPQDKLYAEICRVFDALKGKRWVCCTSHFVQPHCTIEDLEFAYGLIYKKAREIR